MEKVKVYLAGGMKTNWQDRVLERFKSKFQFYDPRDHKLDKSSEYTIWDLFYVGKADIVFAYMEKDNPSGFGLTLEIGSARALGKTVILVDEKSTDELFAPKFRIVRHASSIVFDDIESGMDFLESFTRIDPC